MCGGMKKTKLTLVLVALVVLSACATIDGIGQDISRGAQAVDRTF